MDTVQRNDLPYRWYHELPAKIVPFFEDLGLLVRSTRSR